MSLLNIITGSSGRNGLLPGVVNTITGTVNGLVDGNSNTGVVPDVLGVVGSLTSSGTSAPSTGGGLLPGVVNTVTGTVNGLVDGNPNTGVVPDVLGVVGSLTSSGTSAPSTGGGLVPGLVNTVTGTVNGLVDGNPNTGVVPDVLGVVGGLLSPGTGTPGTGTPGTGTPGTGTPGTGTPGTGTPGTGTPGTGTPGTGTPGTGTPGTSLDFRDYQDLVAELPAINGQLGSWRDGLTSLPGKPNPDQASIQAQRLYIGYYNRAADAGGQQFWVSRLTSSSDIGQASREFANLPEAQALYPVLANPFAASDEAIGAFINSVFRNVFNRDVDPAGASFFLQRFKELRNSPIQGRVGEIVTQILDGAIGDDATILTQKIALANAYTDSLILSNTAYDPEFGQNGIFSTLEAGASTTEALNVAKIIGLGKAEFISGTTGNDTFVSNVGPDVVNLGNDTVADRITFTSLARGGDLVQLFRIQDVLAIQSSGFAGTPLPSVDPITSSVTAAANNANTILVDIRSNLNNANLSNVRLAFDLSSGSFLYDADGNFGGISDQVVLAQLDSFATSGLNLTAANFDFVV